MNAEKWEKINELFHTALEIEASERLQFIQEESGNDEEIIAEVIKLVSAHEEANSFIKNPVANDALKVISDENDSADVPRSFPPKTIGPYNLLKKLGRGAFGEVWLAEKKSSLVTAQFALKFPADYDIEMESIRGEAELWQKASGHPNILPLIEANIYNGQAVIVSEYVKDGSLEGWLKSNSGKSPSQEKAVGIMNGILDGLEHLHNRRIIHRDLKPANILMQEGKPRLTDFGVSKILKDEGNTTKNISGTVAYMSPEALEGKRNFQSDLWAVGVIFYQMLTGKMPFQTPDQVSLMLAIVTKEPFALPPDVKDKWGEFFKIALNKKARLRFQSASQMKQAIEYTWNNLSLEPVTKQYQNLSSPTDENAQTKIFDTNNEKIQSDDFEQKTTLLDLKETQVLQQNSTDSDIMKTGKSKRLVVGIGSVVFALILSVSGYVWITNNNATADLANQNLNVAKVDKEPVRQYSEMSEAEKNEFISKESDKILNEIKVGEESPISQQGKVEIKRFVEEYAGRTLKTSEENCDFFAYRRSSLETVLKRAEPLIPTITSPFLQNKISSKSAIYLAMIDSEFCPCIKNSIYTRGVGVYQITNGKGSSITVRANNKTGEFKSEADILAKNDSCNVEFGAKFQAGKLLFGDGKNLATLSIAYKNAWKPNLFKDLQIAAEIKKEKDNNISFWDLLNIKNKLTRPFIEEKTYEYLPRFFAAAIVGENPQVFGIDMPPLSSFANTSQ